MPGPALCIPCSGRLAPCPASPPARHSTRLTLTSPTTRLWACFKRPFYNRSRQELEASFPFTVFNVLLFDDEVTRTIFSLTSSRERKCPLIDHTPFCPSIGLV